MKKLTIPFLCLIFLLTSCDEDALCLRGSGYTNEYVIDTDDFNKISLFGPVNLSITQDEEIAVSVIAEPEMFADLEHFIKNNTLKIGYMNSVRCFETEKGVWINITVPDLKAIHSQGTSTIKGNGKLNLSDLKIDVDGVAKVTLSGSVKNQVIQVDGSADIYNSMFESKNTVIKVDGSADIEVAVSDNLDIDVDGSAKVKYQGQPKISKKVSGSLNLDSFN